MKLTVQKLKELIKEEMQILEEAPSDLVGDIVSLIKKAMKERGIEDMDEKDIEHIEKVLEDVKKKIKK